MDKGSNFNQVNNQQLKAVPNLFPCSQKCSQENYIYWEHWDCLFMRLSVRLAGLFPLFPTFLSLPAFSIPPPPVHFAVAQTKVTSRSTPTTL